MYYIHISIIFSCMYVKKKMHHLKPNILGKMCGVDGIWNICTMYFFVVCGSTSGPFTTESYSKSKHHYTTIEFNDRIIVIVLLNVRLMHGLRTPNEGINRRNLKIWADVADKICFGRT